MAATKSTNTPIRATLDTSELSDTIEELIVLVDSAREVVRSAREVTTTTEEVAELTGELLAVGTQFVRIGSAWVNPEQVAGVVFSNGRWSLRWASGGYMGLPQGVGPDQAAAVLNGEEES